MPHRHTELKLDHKFEVGERFECGDYFIEIIRIDEEHDTIGYSINTKGELSVRHDVRYRNRFLEGLKEYGY